MFKQRSFTHLTICLCPQSSSSETPRNTPSGYLVPLTLNDLTPYRGRTYPTSVTIRHS